MLAHGRADIPDQNVRFVREFLRVEGIPIIAERVGGTTAMEVWFHTTTGRAQFRQARERLPDLLAEEASARARIDGEAERPAPPGTLF